MSCKIKVVTNEGYERSTFYQSFAGFNKLMLQMGHTKV